MVAHLEKQRLRLSTGPGNPEQPWWDAVEASLMEIDTNFSPYPPVGRRGFSWWVGQIARENFLAGSRTAILEIGGGVKQKIAASLLERGDSIDYVGVDLKLIPRAVVEELRQRAEAVGNRYQDIQGDGNCLPFPAETFDIIFCHNVVLHLKRPFQMTENAYSRLKDGGLFFGNEFLLYRDTWKKIEEELKDREVAFSAKVELPPTGRLKKPGFVKMSLTLEKTGPEPLLFSLRDTGKPLTDFEGGRLISHLIEFDPSRGKPMKDGF